MISQRDEIINLKGKWFFGAEIGNNTITSFVSNEKKNSIQGGIVSEYYFGKRWSVNAKLKYFKTGMSFNYNSIYGRFDGTVLTLPVNIKWEYPIFKNLRGNLKLGLALNKELDSNYSYPIGENIDYPTLYTNLNYGIGINYFINSKTSIFIDYELYDLGTDKNDNGSSDLLIDSADNNLINIGVKYNFRKN
jgi:opacity protein-like surface antigen